MQLLLGVVLSYSSLKDYEGLEWESVKSKYEDVRSDFVEEYAENKGEQFPHDAKLFSEEELRAKLKTWEKRIRKPSILEDEVAVGELWRPFMICEILSAPLLELTAGRRNIRIHWKTCLHYKMFRIRRYPDTTFPL